MDQHTIHPKEQLNVRVAHLTREQMDQLCRITGLNKPEVLALAIDRLWRQELLQTEQLVELDY